jgi:hypothetical protein
MYNVGIFINVTMYSPLFPPQLIYVNKNTLGKQNKTKTRLGVVVHACGSSYFVGWRWGDCSLRPAQAKLVQGPYLKNIKSKRTRAWLKW